jgi:hypothetical protein
MRRSGTDKAVACEPRSVEDVALDIFVAAIVTVLLSVFAHEVSAAPLARRYGRVR